MCRRILQIFATRTTWIVGLIFISWAAAVYAQLGPVDPGFTPPIVERSSTSESRQILALPGNKTLLAMRSSYLNGQTIPSLVRLMADGTLDASFVAPEFKGIPRLMFAYEDGRALVCDDTARVVRLLANGARDPSFESVVGTSSGDILGGSTEDGHLWLWGESELRVTGQRLALVTAEGTPDERFRPDATMSYFPQDAAVGSDGRLILAGTVRLDDRHLHGVFRINFDGSVDPTFDASAVFPQGRTDDNYPSFVAVLPGGDIHAASRRNSWRLRPNGERDTTYRSSLEAISGTDFVYRASPRGEFYYRTSSVITAADSFHRLRVDGTTDPGFLLKVQESALEGPFFPDFSSRDGMTLTVTEPLTVERRQNRAFVSRIDATGAVDPRFAPRISRVGIVDTLLLQPDGKYLLGGWFDYINQTKLGDLTYNLARLHADGSLDSSFRYDAPDEVPGSFPSVLIGVQPDGRIVIQRPDGIRRLEPNGKIDPTFVPVLEISGGTAQLDAAGNLYGVVASDWQIARWTREGHRDPNFALIPRSDFKAFRVMEEGTVVQVAGSTISWHYPDGSSLGPSPLPLVYTRGYDCSILADGGVFFVGDVGTQLPLLNTARVVHVDAAGTIKLEANLRPDFDIVASVFAGIARNKPGVQTLRYHRGGSLYQGTVCVRGGDVTCVRAEPSTERARSSLVRFRPPPDGGAMASLAPAIFTYERDQDVGIGRSAEFVVAALGALPRTVQWFRDGIPVGEAREENGGSHRLSLSQLQPADAGLYTIRLTNAYGVEERVAGRVTVLPPPTIEACVTEVTVSAGQSVALTFSVTGRELQSSYRRNGQPWTGTGFWPLSRYDLDTYTLFLPAVSQAEAGSHEISLWNGVDIRSATIRLNVVDTPSTSRLYNVSARTYAGAGEQSLILGFVVEEGAQGTLSSILARGIGPALEEFKVSGFLTDPFLTLRKGNLVVGTNDDWGGTEVLMRASERVGAFAIKDLQGKDAMILQTSLSGGAYTLQVSGPEPGVALAEVYDAYDGQGAGPRLINLSSRSYLDQANGPMIIGFVIGGTTAQTVLVRATGPSLAKFGIADTLQSVGLRLYDAERRKLAEISGRNDDPVPATIATRVGAFPVTGGSDDPSLVITLPPGAYTAHAFSEKTPRGVVLMEVYEVR